MKEIKKSKESKFAAEIAENQWTGSKDTARDFWMSAHFFGLGFINLINKLIALLTKYAVYVNFTNFIVS
jgi:hypothetical protein